MNVRLCPDIDTDIPDIYRDDIINYVTEKYGKKRVSGIVTSVLLLLNKY